MGMEKRNLHLYIQTPCSEPLSQHHNMGLVAVVGYLKTIKLWYKNAGQEETSRIFTPKGVKLCLLYSLLIIPSAQTSNCQVCKHSIYIFSDDVVGQVDDLYEISRRLFSSASWSGHRQGGTRE